MTRSGFSFIEIIVALLVSSFLSLVLYNSLSQTQRSTKTVSELVDETADLLPCMTQLEKDLSGAFVARMDTVTSSTQPSHKASAGEPQKQSEKKSFHATTKSGSLHELTFVTTNALTIPGEAVPRVVNVTYRLVPQADAADRFELTRMEKPYEAKPAPDDTAKISGRGFVLLRDIKKFVVHYSGLERKQDASKDAKKTDASQIKPAQDGKQTQEKKQTQKKLIRLQEWGTETAQDKTKQPLPVLVEVEATLLAEKNREVTVAYLFYIPAGVCIDQKKDTVQPEQDKKVKDADANKKQQAQKIADPQENKKKSIILMGGGARATA